MRRGGRTGRTNERFGRESISSSGVRGMLLVVQAGEDG